MDTTDPDIFFDAQGLCNHCYRYENVSKKRLFSDNERDGKLNQLVDQIKLSGKNKKYDCIIGVSGGVDSTYVAYLVKKLKLRPLAVHLDNGWNSELSVKNIEKVLKKLDIDLYTYVIDWEEFKDLQLAFLKAATPDSEVPTDHAIIAILYTLAYKYGIKHILRGLNIATESTLPLKWGYGYYDYKYIRNVQKKFGTKKLKSFPSMNLLQLLNYTLLHKIRMVSILNYIKYDKKEAMNILQNDLGWIYYGGKHYESIYTRFFQAYILPRQFDIDKRKAHFSSLIFSGQMTREEALNEMKKETYSSDKLKEDKEYLIKKFGISEQEFEDIMNQPPKTFLDYPTNYTNFEYLKKIRNIFLKSVE